MKTVEKIKYLQHAFCEKGISMAPEIILRLVDTAEHLDFPLESVVEFAEILVEYNSNKALHGSLSARDADRSL
jgi:hypothetical protein